jgi:hypothetical protein
VIALGFLALVIGLILDSQRLFPAVGDRLAALCALFVGQTLVAGTQIGEWVRGGASELSELIGRAAQGVDPQFAAISTLIVGVLVGVAFLFWFLAFLPAWKFLQKWVGPAVNRQLSSGLIWLGVVFPVLIATVPGFWGGFGADVTGQGAGIGEWFTRLVGA